MYVVFLCNNFQVIFSGRSAVKAMRHKAEERHIAILHSTEIPHQQIFTVFKTHVIYLALVPFLPYKLARRHVVIMYFREM
jgi:hypothetical protein